MALTSACANGSACASRRLRPLPITAAPSVKHDGTDRYLAFRGGLAGQFNRQLHVVTPLHTRHYTVPLA